MKDSNLENKIWYRAVKTLYILVYVLIVIVILVWGYSAKPYGIVDTFKSTITCDNGTIHHPDGGSVLIFENGTLGSYDDQQVRKLCIDPSNFPAQNGGAPTNKNYTVQVAFTTIGSWATPFQVWIIGGGIIFVLFEAIRRVFLYIVIGKKFF